MRSAHRLGPSGLTLAWLMLVAVSACSSDAPTGGGTPVGPRRSTTLTIVSGDRQSGEAGTLLLEPLVAQVRDTSGVPVFGMFVRFVRDGTAVVDSVMTDVDGRASVRWTLGTVAQTQRIIARGTVIVGSLIETPEAVFTATAFAGPVAAIRLSVHEPIGLPGSALDTVSAFVTDRFGNPVDGAPVAWTVERGGGSVRALSAHTLVFGVARAIFTLGPTSGDNVLSVRSAALTDRITAVASPGFLATSVAVGATHTCAISASGDPYCWGSNQSGQLGIERGDQASQRVPARVANALRFTSMVAGAFHTCGLTVTGSAYCWGINDHGALGSNGPTAISPTRVAAPESFTALAAGGRHTCGLTITKAILCWGDHTAGQIGDGSDRSTLESMARVRRPIPTTVVGGHEYVALAASYNTTCAIVTTGDVHCWGSNVSRELGTGTAGTCVLYYDDFYYPDDGVWSCRTSPGRVDMPWKLTSISASGSGICGVTTGSELVCWGNNQTRAELVPDVRVSAAWVLGSVVCAQSGDVVRCWSLVSPAGFPLFPRIHVFDADEPLVALSGSAASACGLSRAQPAVTYCWGRNDAGQVGDGTTEFRRLPVPVGFPRASQ